MRPSALAFCAAAILFAAGCSVLVDLAGISDGVATKPAPSTDASAGDSALGTDASGDASDAMDAAPAETVLRTVTFEDGALVHPVTGADEVEGQVKLETASPLRGAVSARVTAPNGSGTSMFRCALAQPRSDLAVTLVLRIHALPSGSLRIVRFAVGSQTVAELSLDDEGRLGVAAPGSSAVRSTPLAVGVAHQIRMRKSTGSAGTFDAATAPEGQPLGLPFGSVGSSEGVDGISFGQTVSNNYGMDIVIDDVVIAAPGLSGG